jgi:hypothetical protein
MLLITKKRPPTALAENGEHAGCPQFPQFPVPNFHTRRISVSFSEFSWRCRTKSEP